MQRLRFILNPIGSHGDVDPVLAIGTELQRRGHEVFVLANAAYRDLVNSLGMRFVRVGKKQEMQQIGTDPRIRTPGKAWKIALQWCSTNTMRETYAQIERLNVNGRTIIGAAVTSFGARLANERLGIPMASLIIDPDKLRGSRHSPVMPPLVLSDWVPRVFKKSQYWVADRFVIDPLVAPLTNQFRKELGLPPVNRLLHRWCFSDDLVIGLFDEWFAPRSSDWPANVQLVGPILWNPTSSEDSGGEIFEFASNGSPPLAFVAGSAGPRNAQFFEVAMKSAIELGQRAIFLHNNPNIIPPDLPDTIRYCRHFAPLHSLLSRCSALVHHAGTGTAFHALSAGIPQLASPQAFDQPDIAMRLHRLGVGSILPAKKFTVRKIVAKLRSLLNDPDLLARCRSLSNRLADRKPAATAANLMEQLLQPTDPAWRRPEIRPATQSQSNL